MATFALLGITDATLRVVRLVDGAWEQVGPIVSDTDIRGDQCPALAVGADDSIYAAFQQSNSAPFQFRVRRFDGTAWVDELIRDSSIALPARDFDLAVGPSGEPVLAVLEPHPTLFGYSVNVYRRVGGTFVHAPALGSSDVQRVRIVVRDSGNVVALITHINGPFSGAVRVIELDASAWVDHGEVAVRPDTTSSLISGYVDADAGSAWFTYFRGVSGAHSLHAVRHDSGGYAPLDDRFPAVPLGHSPSIALGPAGELALAYTDNGVFTVRRIEDGAPDDVIVPPGFGFLIDAHYEGEQLYAACALSSGGASSNAVLVRVNFPAE